MLSRTAARSVRCATMATRPVASRRLASNVSESKFGGGAGDPVEDARAREALTRDTKRNPELFVLAGVMTCAFGLAGYFFAAKPTSSTSEKAVTMAQGSYPWESGTSGKYQYHPDGDRTLAPRDAPSALHSVTIPNVNLPKELHDQFNKYDKEEFDDY